MTQRIVVDDDSVDTPLTLAAAEVTVEGGIRLSGTGHATIGDKAVCLVKDVIGKRYTYTYTSGIYETPGQGTMTIDAVAADHVHSADAVMVSGGKVTLIFTTGVGGEARDTTPEQTPDPAPPSGAHEFILKMSNDFVSTDAD